MNWRDHAACKGKPTAWWFAQPNTPDRARAEQICKTCPVVNECVDAGRNERGLWGKPRKGEDWTHVPHGTRRGYTHYKCRCDPCRDAYSTYKAQWRELRDVQHGTRTRYVKGCRCVRCADAERNYKLRRRVTERVIRDLTADWETRERGLLDRLSDHEFSVLVEREVAVRRGAA